MSKITVYRHRRLDTNDIFYIGIGNSKRPYDKSHRSSFWKSIVDKIPYEIEIIADNLTWEDACELEVFLIELYGRRDLNTGTLCNLTDGGDGSLGYKHTEKHREYVKILNSNRVWTEESKRKLGETQKNRVNNKFNNQSGGDNLKAKLVLDTQTGVYYSNLKEASNIYSINYTTLKDWLGRYSYRNKSNLIYV